MSPTLSSGLLTLGYAYNSVSTNSDIADQCL